MNKAKLALLLVVFVDVLGQGLIFPIINTLMVDPKAGFLPVGTSAASREFYYGLVIGTFFLAWFLGAAYISKLSDMIGRKAGIQICLFGALIGYALTILSLYTNSLWLLILGRAITGFTAGNQPIAQAAMIDLSRDEFDKARNMGFIVASFSLSLIAGPLMGGLLSDKDILGDVASLELPFYVAAAIIVMVIVLVALFFQDTRQERAPVRFEPAEIFLLLWRIVQRPVVLRISVAYFFFMFTSNMFFVFMDNYLSIHFRLGTFGTSMAMMAFGAALAATSAFLVGRLNARFARSTLIAAGLVAYILTVALFIGAPTTVLSFVAIVLFGFFFAVAYPTFLGVFSASVSEEEQGWVMGVTTALFTLGAGIASFVGGMLLSLDVRAPFYLAIASAILSLALMGWLWRTESLRRLVAIRQSADG